MSSHPNQENLSPHIVREVYKQLKSLTSEPIEGVQIHVKEEDVSEIHATIEGPQGTPYAGGVFKMKLCLTRDFPAQPPRGFFITKIFHPNVSNNGDICVNVLKKDWHAKMGIRNVLLTIKCLLIHPNPESALNEEAGRLLLEQYQNFANRAKLMTEIHAKPTTKSTLTNHNMNEEQPSTSKTAESAVDLKKQATEKLLAEKKRKEKRRGLKRL